MKQFYFPLLVILNCALCLSIKIDISDIIDPFVIKTQTTINYLKKIIPDEILKDNLESKNIVLQMNKNIIRNNINFCKLINETNNFIYIYLLSQQIRRKTKKNVSNELLEFWKYNRKLYLQ